MLAALGSLGRSAGASRAILTTSIAITTTTATAAPIWPTVPRVCGQCKQRPFSATATAPAGGNTRWKARQGKDQYAREAKVRGLKSRAAFKLLEMDSKYRLFKPGQTIVDLVSIEMIDGFFFLLYLPETANYIGLCSRKLVTSGRGTHKTGRTRARHRPDSGTTTTRCVDDPRKFSRANSTTNGQRFSGSYTSAVQSGKDIAVTGKLNSRSRPRERPGE